MKNDTQATHLQHAVLAELESDPSVNAASVGVGALGVSTRKPPRGRSAP